METSSSTSLNTGYPLYDTHGNMVATAQVLNNGNSWQTGNIRQYDVWGSVRQGASTGDPKGRYCANLGHVQDDESGLVYMRARYYEPSTGRFISEDKSADGNNWYMYARNSPTNYVDADGHDALKVIKIIAQILLFVGSLILLDHYALAESALYRLTKHISQAQSMIRAGLTEIMSEKDVMELHSQLEEKPEVTAARTHDQEGKSSACSIGIFDAH